MYITIEQYNEAMARKDAELVARDETIAAITAENDRHHEAFSEISSACIGALTMCRPLDADDIGRAIYDATGMANPELHNYANNLTNNSKGGD